MSENVALPPSQNDVRPKYTESPNPGFAYGRKVSETPEGKAWVDGERAGWKTVDGATEDPARMVGFS